MSAAAAPARKIFVAGSTGAIGRTVIRLADAGGHGGMIIPHLRPKNREGTPDPRAAVCDLGDEAALTRALTGCTTVLQLIGTMRERFAAGDTYETSDIGTTRSLVAAAKRAGTVDHLIILSSVGAGGMGAYLKAKAAAEQIVQGSGIPWTIVRPSAFDGEGHHAPPGLGAITSLLHLSKYKPIATDDLGRAILRAALDRAPLGAVLEGNSLWAQVARAAA